MSISLGFGFTGFGAGSTFVQLQPAGNYFIDGFEIIFQRDVVTGAASMVMYLNTLNNTANRVIFMSGVTENAAGDIARNMPLTISGLAYPWPRNTPIWLESNNGALTTSSLASYQLFGRVLP